ncbi:EAL domain-containing protein [Parvularcula sp. ZS-1/3]|uniref:EAL domain-containing protein n=1 Tax=Parvularcula mediterranea TaxID=2732508 RepID=A0A7Y3W6C9_9PROT|nr:EAL domain-containing protein [Parvularcula mediterranea]
MDEALVSRQIHLLYQPIFSLQDGSLARVEALCRWDHPRFGTMLPAVFLPAFEAEDRLAALTRRILERSAAEFASWAFSKPSGLSINLSPADCIDPGLPASVKAILEATRLDPEMVTFECPVRVSDTAEAAPILTELKELGVRLAAELMGRGDEIAEVFAIAPFDEIKTGGRGLLRAVRNDHTASLQNAADLIAFAESKGAIVSAIGAEDEAACLALRTMGFHQCQANVLSGALPIDGITPKVTNAARQLLGLDETSVSEADATASPEEAASDTFKAERLRAQAEAFKRVAEKRADAENEEAPRPPRGAKSVQNRLAESFGDPKDGDDDAGHADARDQQEVLMQAESKAGLLMRPDLASASLGYGASPLRRARRRDNDQQPVIVVEANETLAKRLSKEPEVAQAITEVLGDLPPAVEEREGERSEDDIKADELDEAVAKLPTLDDETAAVLKDAIGQTAATDELMDLASRLRPTPKRRNLLTRRYKLRVTHFWPRPWRRAYDKLIADRQGLSDKQFLDRLGAHGPEQDTVPMVPLSADETKPTTVTLDEGSAPVDEGTEALETSETLSAAKAR